jgi:hypothetical protein
MDWTAVLEASLSFFLVVTALGLAYVLLKMGGTFARLNIFLKRLDEEVIPLLSKLQVTMEEVNSQLGKLDEMMATMVGVTDRVDATTRALSTAIVSPVKKAAGLSAGVSEAISSLIKHQGRG